MVSPWPTLPREELSWPLDLFHVRSPTPSAAVPGQGNRPLFPYRPGVSVLQSVCTVPQGAVSSSRLSLHLLQSNTHQWKPHWPPGTDEGISSGWQRKTEPRDIDTELPHRRVLSLKAQQREETRRWCQPLTSLERTGVALRCVFNKQPAPQAAAVKMSWCTWLSQRRPGTTASCLSLSPGAGVC